MPNSFVNYTPKEWEKFCETMIRQHFGESNFWSVPDEDRGDHGIEFFTSTGTIFQCYFPDPKADMKAYKTKVQKKINSDLKKLTEYGKDISELLDKITINQWVILIPEDRSRELIKYCNSKKKEVIEHNICNMVAVWTAKMNSKVKIYKCVYF